jgi:nitrate reductase gamma subunit
VAGIAWQVLVYASVVFSFAGLIYRALRMARLPVHLRWELAPVPAAGPRADYGGSHLEAFEFWTRPRRRARTAALVYIVHEALTLRSVWKGNRGLWPLSFTLHLGLYLTALLYGLTATYAALVAWGRGSPMPAGAEALSWAFLPGFLLGGLGSIGLLLRRAIDPRLAPFNTPARFLNLLMLATLFATGAYAWSQSAGFAEEVIRTARGLIPLNGGLAPTLPLAVHLSAVAAFLVYLPLSDMVHFVAKYFTYHAVRWDDRPLDPSMERELMSLMSQPVGWAAPHIAAPDRKEWKDLATAGTAHDPTA